MSSTKQQLFVCPTCSKGFTRVDYLSRHEKNHNDNKPFKCHQCSFSFTRSDLLAKHFKSKYHQRIRDSEQKGTSNVAEASTDTINSKDQHSTKSLEVQTYTSQEYGRIHSTDTGSLSQLDESKSYSTRIDGKPSNVRDSSHFQEGRQLKKYKRLGISSFLNQNEKLPAPPPQPSIILPAASKTVIRRNSSPDSAKGNDSGNHKPSSRECFNLTPMPYDNANSKTAQTNNVSPPMSKMFGNGTNEDLFWLSNDSSPLSNLFWFFNDMPSGQQNLKDDNKISTKQRLTPAETFDDSHLLSGTDQFPSIDDINTDNIDIPPVMYQNLYNESANTKINNNKINMTEETRSRIIEIFPSVTQLEEISLERFEEYIDLYWFNFAQTFPIIHQATFNPNSINIYLLISMIVIGMAHSMDKMEYQTSICVNKKYRRVIYDVIEENTELPLPLIQALILHNFSAKNFGDSQLTKIAQIDHGANIMYLKFSGFLDKLNEPLIHKPKNAKLSVLKEQWHNWIYYETCKRTVFFEFICDVQHVTFNKLELLSVFDISLELPSTDEVWNCADPVKFFEEYQKQPRGLQLIENGNRNFSYNNRNGEFENGTSLLNTQERSFADDNYGPTQSSKEYFSFFTNKTPRMSSSTNQQSSGSGVSSLSSSAKMFTKWPTFLWSLKSILSTLNENQWEYSLECYSLFSRYILLHGLLRICWDMREQGISDLGNVSKRTLGDFTNRLEMAFLNWKSNFDLHVKLYEEQVKSGESSGGDKPNPHLIFSLNNYGPTNASWANVSFYYTGLFFLYADIPSVTKFASEYKNVHFTNKASYKSTKERDHEKNLLVIDQWVRSKYGGLSLLQACQFLRLVYGNEETVNTFSHVPQTIFLAALIVWCYEIKRETLQLKGKADSDNIEFGADGIKLDTSKYFDVIGNINFELAKSETFEYFSLIMDSEKSAQLGPDRINDHNAPILEQLRERQNYSVGVVCYVLHLLRNCKWFYSIDLVHQLEHVVTTYDD